MGLSLEETAKTKDQLLESVGRWPGTVLSGTLLGKLRAYALCGLRLWLMCIRDGSQSVLTSGDLCSGWLYRAPFWSLVSGLGLHG